MVARAQLSSKASRFSHKFKPCRGDDFLYLRHVLPVLYPIQIIDTFHETFQGGHCDKAMKRRVGDAHQTHYDLNGGLFILLVNIEICY